VNGLSARKVKSKHWAYDQDGNLVWVIEEAPHGGEDQDKTYMNLSLEKGKLIAGNFIGIDYFVNEDTGTVSPVKTSIRPW
jgi:hypothetical protein